MSISDVGTPQCNINNLHDLYIVSLKAFCVAYVMICPMWNILGSWQLPIPCQYLLLNPCCGAEEIHLWLFGKVF
jgi:hypothetical protein